MRSVSPRARHSSRTSRSRTSRACRHGCAHAQQQHPTAAGSGHRAPFRRACASAGSPRGRSSMPPRQSIRSSWMVRTRWPSTRPRSVPPGSRPQPRIPLEASSSGTRPVSQPACCGTWARCCRASIRAPAKAGRRWSGWPACTRAMPPWESPASSSALHLSKGTGPTSSCTRRAGCGFAQWSPCWSNPMARRTGRSSSCEPCRQASGRETIS